MNSYNSTDIIIGNKSNEDQELKETMNPTKSHIVDYYLDRYFEIHNYVINSRISKIDEEIQKCENSYQDLLSREDHLEEIANRNKEIQIEIDELTLEINENNNYFCNKQGDFNDKAQKVTEKENNILLACKDYYQNILSKLSQNNFQDTIEYVQFVLDVLKYTFYNEVTSYLSDAKEALKQLDELNELELQVKKRNMELSQKIDELSRGIEKISFEETEKKLDDLAYEISNKKKSKEELTTLFVNLKKQNIKYIVDEIRHLQILEYNQQQVALEMDKVVLDFKNSLAVVDTNSNIQFAKTLKLKKLKEQLQQLQPLKDEYDKVNDEYNHLVSMHQTISTNINDIEEYSSQTKNLIESNQEFKALVNRYSDILVKKTTYDSNYNTLKVRQSNLVESRKSKLNDPYGKIELVKIDEELKNVQETLETFKNESLALNKQICLLKDTEQDSRLITVYEDCLMCDEKLANLYERQREFSSIINEKYILLSNLKLKINKYDETYEQVEILENEINNI